MASRTLKRLSTCRDGGVDDGWLGRSRRPGALAVVPFQLILDVIQPSRMAEQAYSYIVGASPCGCPRGGAGDQTPVVNLMPIGHPLAGALTRYMRCLHYISAYSIQQRPYVVQPRSA